MATHSVKGASSNAYRHLKAKPALPVHLVDAICRKSLDTVYKPIPVYMYVMVCPLLIYLGDDFRCEHSLSIHDSTGFIGLLHMWGQRREKNKHMRVNASYRIDYTC